MFNKPDQQRAKLKRNFYFYFFVIAINIWMYPFVIPETISYILCFCFMKQFVKTTRMAQVVQKIVDIALVDSSVIIFLGLVPLGVMLVITMIAVKQVHIGKDKHANFPPLHHIRFKKILICH